MFAPALAVYGVFDTPQEEEKSVSMSDAMRSFLSSDAADDVTSSFFLIKIEREQRERESAKREKQTVGDVHRDPATKQEGSSHNQTQKTHQPSRFGLSSPRRAHNPPSATLQASMNKSFGSYDLPSFPSSVVGGPASVPMPTYTIREPQATEGQQAVKQPRAHK